MFGKFYHVIRKYAIDTSLNVFTIGVASTIYITDAQRRKDQHRTIISNNNTIELLEDRIEGLVEERLQLLYKSRQMNDSLSKSIQEQQKWIAELKEFEKECKEGTRHQDPGKQRR